MILEATAITKDFKVKQKKFRALDRVSFALDEKEVLGIVGESGSGKSTLGEIVGGLQKPTSGSVYYDGKDISNLNGDDKTLFRRSVQFVFQSPKETMNPYFSIRTILAEPLRINYRKLSKTEIERSISDMLIRVGMDPKNILSYRPSHFSAGQLQRIAIARALLLDPRILICDECTSSLDVSLQAQILNLLVSLKKEIGVSMIFISHDISVVRYISDRIMVMKDGHVVEIGESDEIITSPKDSYTKTLVETAYR